MEMAPSVPTASTHLSMCRGTPGGGCSSVVMGPECSLKRRSGCNRCSDQMTTSPSDEADAKKRHAIGMPDCGMPDASPDSPAASPSPVLPLTSAMPSERGAVAGAVAGAKALLAADEVPSLSGRMALTRDGCAARRPWGTPPPGSRNRPIEPSV